MFRKLFRSLLMLLTLIPVLVPIVSVIHAQEEGIPGNCPYTHGVYYNQNLFPRYEVQNQRLVMADWSTGADVREIATGVSAQQFEIGRWSPECQYLSMSFGTPDEKGVVLWDTYVWDVVNGGQIAFFEDARLIPYPLTWDTNSTQLLVETRFGAYLWKVNGGQVWLTSEADYNAHSFVPGTLRWDYAANQLTGRLAISPNGTAVYDLSSGTLLSLTDQWGRQLDPNRTQLRDTKASPNGEKYPCIEETRYGSTSTYIDGTRIIYEAYNQRVVLQDAGTREVIRVLVENVAASKFGAYFIRQCSYLIYQLDRTNTVFYDLEKGQAVFMIEDALIRQFAFDPTRTYAVITTRHGASLYHLLTGWHTTLVPHVQTSNLGSGSVWAFSRVTWDVPNNRVKVGFNGTVEGSQVIETKVYDLTTGALLEVLNFDGQPKNDQEFTARKEQIAAPYGCRFRVQYRSYNQQVVLQDPVTPDLITVVEDQLALDSFQFISQSPDCHYLAAAVGIGNQTDTYIWDLVTGKRVGAFEDSHEIPHTVEWSPYGGYAVISTRNGAYLWNLVTDSRVLLTSGADHYRVNIAYWRTQFGVHGFYDLEWDMTAGHLLGVPVDRGNVVVVYDLATGQPVTEYGTAERVAPVNFMQFGDGRLLIYTTTLASDTVNDQANALALWNRHTGQGIQLAMDFYSTPFLSSPLAYSNPEFSADGRYMLMRSASYVYIWDLNGLAGNEPHLPNYTHKVASTQAAHFASNTTFVTRGNTTSRYQMARSKTEITTYIYDVVSGALISETPEIRPYDYFYQISRRD